MIAFAILATGGLFASLIGIVLCLISEAGEHDARYYHKRR